MTISDWRIYKVRAYSSMWKVEVRYASAPDRLQTGIFFSELFGEYQLPYVVINGVKVIYSGFKVENIEGTIVSIYLRKRSLDYYSFPPFLSWNWTLSLEAWYTGGVDDTFTVTGTGPSSSVDPFELGSNPFAWEVSAVDAPSAGIRNITVQETSGASEELVLSYVLNFFLKNSVIFINSKQYICANPGVKTAANQAQFFIHEESYVPAIGETIEVTTLNSSMDTVLDQNAFDVILQDNSIDKNSLKVFFDFNNFDGNHIQSSNPAISGTYSGEVFGAMSSFTGDTHLGEGFFNRDHYVKIANSEELFSNNFTFLFSCSKTDNQPANLFSNLGGYTNPTSGFAIGLNSANMLYFQNYEYLKPNILTLNTKNAQKNIFCVLGAENSLQMGKYNFTRNEFDFEVFGLDENFIRQSNDWYIGSGSAIGTEDYSFDGYMDYFMYFNQTLGQNQATALASGVFSNTTGVPPKIRSVPIGVTGYTLATSGVSGIIGYSGVLSGQEMTRYTGYAVTGTGLTGLLNITGDYNLYITGDSYSGFYMQANLDDYEVGNTGATFYDVVDAPPEVSAIAYDPNRQLLLVPDNDNNNVPISELDLEGNFIRTISSDISDVEAMCYMTGDYFAIGTETATAKIYYGPINKTTDQINSSDWSSITLPVWGAGLGLEGITFDQGRNCFYAVKEGPANKGVYKVLFNGTTTLIFNPSLTDLSDIHYDKYNDNLFIASHQDDKVIQTDMVGNVLYEKEIPLTQLEGLTFTPDMKKMYVAGEPKEGGYFRLNENLVKTYELLRNYTGFFSGDNEFQLTLYEEKLFSGINIQPVTGFSTGLHRYEYTGYENVYVQSGITGYNHTGHEYSALSGNSTGFLVVNSGNRIVASTDIYDYFYDKISYIGDRAGYDDMVEYNYREYDLTDATDLDLASAKNFNSFATFEYAPIRRSTAFTLKLGSDSDQINLFLNGVGQFEGDLEVSQNDYYQNIYDTETGDYSLIDDLVVNDKDFQTTSVGEDQVLYDLTQPEFIRQRAAITGVEDWRDAATLGVSGDEIQAFFNGQKIYSGIDYVSQEGYLSGQGFVTGITGYLFTFPEYENLENQTGVGLYDITGKFLVDNIYYLNGVRQDPNAFLVYATGVGLIEGTGIEIESKGTIVYNKDVSYGSD